jgi:hypothetical protein
MKSQEMEENQQMVFMSDGGEDARVQKYLHPNSQHIIDWSHNHDALAVLQQQTKTLPSVRRAGGPECAKELHGIIVIFPTPMIRTVVYSEKRQLLLSGWYGYGNAVNEAPPQLVLVETADWVDTSVLTGPAARIGAGCAESRSPGNWRVPRVCEFDGWIPAL